MNALENKYIPVIESFRNSVPIISHTAINFLITVYT